ncbi:hypothetical protein ACWGE0_29125 [Lentzea sp. NPDC054927]
MTGWSQEDLDELWGDVLDGGADEESIAALPLLADMADDPELAEQAVAIAGAIMASAGTRDDHLAATFLTAANRLLPTTDDYYANLLAAQLTFEGTGFSPRQAAALDLRTCEIPCPACHTSITLLFDLSLAKASFVDEIGDTSQLKPQDPATLTGIGLRLYDTAAEHGQEHVQLAVTHLFGQATCPLCAAGFTVADRLL